MSLQQTFTAHTRRPSQHTLLTQLTLSRNSEEVNYLEQVWQIVVAARLCRKIELHDQAWSVCGHYVY
ncbi:hypothetical protein MHYP_G00009100 [Metynnis hypsauchen]